METHQIDLLTRFCFFKNKKVVIFQAEIYIECLKSCNGNKEEM